MRKAKFQRKTSISLADDIYEILIKRSTDNEISLGEMIRVLVEKGLEAEKLEQEQEKMKF